MLKKYSFLLFAAFLGFFLITTTSCNKKTGCPINENAHVKTGKKGQLPTKRGKSNLLPKKMRKKN